MNSEIPLIQAWIERKQVRQASIRLRGKGRFPNRLLDEYFENAVLICQAEKQIVEKMNA